MTSRDDRRARFLDAIPRSYNPWLHLAATTGIGVLVLALGAWGVRSVRPIELLVVPLVFLVANGFEWRAHKDLMHHRRRPFTILYDRHTPQHHAVYVESDMAIRDWRELKLVLIPAWGVAGIVITLTPIAIVAALLTTANCGWLVLVTGGVYMVGYELSHLAYHLPSESLVGRLALVRVLRRHHARHHDPRLMQRWNFNVTIPLFDWLHGTVWCGPRRGEGADVPSAPRRVAEIDHEDDAVAKPI